MHVATSRHGQDCKVRGHEQQNPFHCVCVKCVSHSVRGVKDVSYIPGGFSQGEAACLDLARIRCLGLPVSLQKLTAETETAAGGRVALQRGSSEVGMVEVEAK